MKKIVATCLVFVTFCLEAATLQSSPTDEAFSNTISLSLLDITFDRCVDEYSQSLGKKMVGSYCQCVSKEYYQNMSHSGFLRYLEGLTDKEEEALTFKNQTSSICLAQIAKHIDVETGYYSYKNQDVWSYEK